MIQKEFQTFLEDTLGVKIDALKSALTSDEEVKIEFNQGTFLNDDDLTAVKDKLKKQGYNDGKIAGVEMAAKELKESFGIEAEGKDLKGIFEAYGSKVLTDAKIEPNKKIQELQSSLDTLRTTYETDLSVKDQEINTFKGKLDRFNINQTLMSELPEALSLNPKHFMTLAETEFQFELGEDGSPIVKKNGQILKDKLEKPVSPKQVLSEFAESNGFLGGKKPTGRGGKGGYTPPTGSDEFKTQHDVYRYMEKNRIDPASDEGWALVDNFNKQNG